MSDPFKLDSRPKRSSLKYSNPLNSNDILNYNNNSKKRNSVSWNLNAGLAFKGLKFDNLKEETKTPESIEKKKKFENIRRQSVKNEFSMVKELMKQKQINIDEEISDDEEIKKNTNKNIELAKNAVKEESSESSSSSSSPRSSNSENEENNSKNKEENENYNNKLEKFEEKYKKFEKNVEKFDEKVKEFEEKLNKISNKK